MAKEVEVLFTEERKGQFRMGQKKRVKYGYARNYLFPQNLAVPLTKEHEDRIKRVEKEAENKLAAAKSGAEDVHAKLNEKVVTFTQKAHDEGKLYGSVNPSDVASRLNIDFETEIDKYDLKMITSIKEVGEYPVYVDIHPDVKTKLTVVVEAEIDKEAEAAKEKKRIARQKAEEEEAKYKAEREAAENNEDVESEQ